MDAPTTGWLVFYIEAESSNEESPATLGGDWIPNARSAVDAVRRSQEVMKVDGAVAYVVRAKDCVRFAQTKDWRRIE